MAIIDKTKQRFINDRDENVYMGIDLPFRKSSGPEGWFVSTTTTIAAVRENVRLFLLTERGDRLMNPDLGISIRKYLFEPITENTEQLITQEIYRSINRWLPFVKILDIVVTADEESGKNGFEVFLKFGITGDPMNLESVSINITS